MLTDLIPDCKEKMKTHIPYIGKSRIMWYCFGDYEKWSSRMEWRCKYCRPKVRECCVGGDVSKVFWSPIIITVSKYLKE